MNTQFYTILVFVGLVGAEAWRLRRSKKARSPYIPYNARPESRFKKAAVACFAGGIVLGLVLTALPADGNLAARAGIATAAAISVWFSTRLFDGANVQEAK